MSRQLTFTGTGTLNSWSEPAALASQITSQMRAGGWGVSDIQITYAPGGTGNIGSLISNPVANLIPTLWNYVISGTMEGVADDADTEGARNVFLQYLSSYFHNINLALSYDSAHPAASFLKKYGLWIAGGVGVLLLLKRSTPVIVQTAREFRPRYY